MPRRYVKPTKLPALPGAPRHRPGPDGGVPRTPREVAGRSASTPSSSARTPPPRAVPRPGRHRRATVRHRPVRRRPARRVLEAPPRPGPHHGPSRRPRRHPHLLLPGRQAAGDVFDVQLAAGLVGLTYPIGYARACQRSARPADDEGRNAHRLAAPAAPPAQVRYAFDDVRYLLPAWKKLTDRMKAVEADRVGGGGVRHRRAEGGR